MRERRYYLTEFAGTYGLSLEEFIRGREKERQTQRVRRRENYGR